MQNRGAKNLVTTGKNENGENVIITIYPDKTVVRTLQKNNWMRINIYWNNGDVEEVYER